MKRGYAHQVHSGGSRKYPWRESRGPAASWRPGVGAQWPVADKHRQRQTKSHPQQRNISISLSVINLPLKKKSTCHWKEEFKWRSPLLWVTVQAMRGKSTSVAGNNSQKSDSGSRLKNPNVSHFSVYNKCVSAISWWSQTKIKGKIHWVRARKL